MIKQTNFVSSVSIIKKIKKIIKQTISDQNFFSKNDRIDKICKFYKI